MADAQAKVVAEEQPKTEQQLMEEMNVAVKSGDYKLVAKVAQELVKFQKTKEAAELAEKMGRLEVLTTKVREHIAKALAKMVNDGELDEADGIWYGNDFGSKDINCRLMKVTAKTTTTGKTGGNGGGKKFNVGTTELLEKFGSDVYKDGVTFQVAWESNVDKNWRYAIREALLKKAGVTS